MQSEYYDIEQLLSEGKNIQIKPQGYSMYPVLVPDRDEVIVEPVGNRRLKRGDVVLYRRYEANVKGILVLHRIFKCTKSEFFLVGDNQSEIEGPLKREQIKGIMVGMIRKGKYLSCKNLWYCVLTRGWLLLRPFRKGISQVVAKIKRAFI